MNVNICLCVKLGQLCFYELSPVDVRAGFMMATCKILMFCTGDH